MIDIYTDGSHLKHTTGRLGCGGVMLKDGKKVDEFSIEIDPEQINTEFGSKEVSNPTAEMIGLLEALRFFDFKKERDIVVHADYLGVKSWMEGSWKIKEPYIKKIKDQIEKVIKQKQLNVKYDWVKGHQKKSILSMESYWNNYVDKLAKGI